MTKLLDSTLVLCDLDHLLLAGDGNMPQVVRDVLQLFSSRGGRLTVFSQRSPRAVRAVLGGCALLRPRSPAAVRWPTGSRRAAASRCAASRAVRSPSSKNCPQLWASALRCRWPTALPVCCG